MTTRTRQPLRSTPIDRRTLVRGTAGLAAGAAFAHAGLPAAAQEATSPITIPEPVTTLPSDDVTFRWIDSGDVKGFYWRAFFEQYEAAHPNITVEYQGLPWNEIQTVIPLGIQNGSAPDVFQIPMNVPAPLAVAEG